MNAYVDQLRATEQKMVDKDKKAKLQFKLVGRYINEPCADSYAYYEIVKENKNTVTIQWLDIWDGWTIPYWGKKATIKKDFAVEALRHRDLMAKLFAKKG